MASKEHNERLLSIVSEIRSFCLANADEKQAARYARYFKEGYDPYGIAGDLWKNHELDFYNAYRDHLGLNGFLDLGDLLLQSGKYEEASFAICSIKPFYKQYTADTFVRVGLWLESGVRNWAHTDTLCGEVVSRFFKRGVASLSDMSSWRESPSKWKRRAAPVSMITLLKLTEDYEQLLDFIRPLMLDEERVVQQGLGWFLREAWKKKPGPVEAFLHEWKNSSPRLIFQYATEKMTPEQKAGFRKGKKQQAGIS